ncbi:MAG TPA: DUF2231 domain-containing protein [Kofleriaceae bacterium]|nr:DUF2231 domain-containing protein [Kofleriaceae bacterium]
MYSRAKFLGHPIHPMVVGFPIAFYTATLGALIIYGATGDAFWYRLMLWTNLVGVVMAAVAAIPGLIDWAFGIPRGSRAKTIGLSHMALNVGALALFIINLIIQFARWQGGDPASTALGIILCAVGLGLTLGAGALGWVLVQTHHVGIHPLSEDERVRARAEIEQTARLSREPRPEITPLRPIEQERRPGEDHPPPTRH